MASAAEELASSLEELARIIPEPNDILYLLLFSDYLRKSEFSVTITSA